jgi:hypothetical protein
MLKRVVRNYDIGDLIREFGCGLNHFDATAGSDKSRGLNYLDPDLALGAKSAQELTCAATEVNHRVMRSYVRLKDVLSDYRTKCHYWFFVR